MAIQVGSVEVDVVPNTRGIYTQLRAALVPAATRAGEDAGTAAGRSFGPAMQRQVGDVGLRIGEEIGQQIATRLTASLRDSVRDGVNQAGRTARPAATRQGDETAGAFSRALRTHLEAAFRSLPRLTIDADTSEADSDLQALRFRMETLADQRIGIDIEATDARAEIRLIEAELTRLGASHPNVQVRADTARALAELGAVHAAIDAVDGKRARIDVDTAGATSAVLHLAVAIGGLAAIPAIPVIAAGIGAIASAAVAATVGVGALAAVAVPAIIGIAGALQAQKAAQDAATTSSLRGAQTSSRGASSALQLAGAQQALATAHRNAARQIRQAEESVSDAVRSAADANTRAVQEVAQARQALADAVQQAADRQLDAAERVARAEESLADSQRSARQAQLDLTQARKDAALELAELGDRLTNAQLSEQDAVLSVQEAQARLRAATAKGSKATLLEQQRAQLAYDQAVQRLKEQRAETKRLTAEKAAADKAGVEGSEAVKSAQEQIAEAESAVTEQQKALGDARKDAARQQVQSQRDIAEAQEKVAESQRNVIRVQEDGARSVARAQESLAAAQQSAADSIASAQRQIASAQQSAAAAAAGGIDQAAIAQAKYEQSLAKLTPAARATFDAFTSLRSAFTAWSESLQPAVMPIFTRALNGLKNSLPGLTPFVLAAAEAIGRLQDRVSRGFKSPWWKQFKAELAGSVGPATEGLGVSFGRIFKGMAGIIDAFLPHMQSISDRMQAITGRFAAWGTSLKGSDKFERFLSYSAQQAPIIAGAFGAIGSALYEIARAASPLSGPILKALGAVASALASIAETLPWLIQLMYAAWVVTKLWTLAMIAFNLVMAANPITLIILGIIALVAAVVYAYKNFDWFRNTVQAVWKGIQVAAQWAWENVLKPVFEGLVTAFKAVAEAAVWLWETILKPVFGFIADAAAVLFTAILTILIAPLVLAFKALAAVAEWLWEKVFKPTFEGIARDATWLWKNILSPIFTAIGAAAKWLWENGVRPAFENLKKGFRQLGDAAKWVWDSILKPVFSWIGDKAGWLWQKALKPAFANIKTGIEAVGKSFDSTRGFIDRAWSKVADIAKKPVRFIIDKVYNAGIVPTWNMIAKAFGAPEIERMETKGWARGGILPGQSSFRQGDDQLVPMRRGEGVYVSEAMRDPYERARLHAVNRAAMAGKPLDQYQGFAKGGIFDWVGSASSKVVDLAQAGASWLKDGVKASATAGLNAVVEPLIKRISGSASLYRDMVTGIPRKIVKTILGFSGEADKRLGQVGIGGGGFARGLAWARTQAGLPYQWGGNGNPSWDCSGLVSAVESVIRGQDPHRRWATGSFSGKTAPPGWVLNGRSPYRIGITNAGVGHTAGTINGVNVESRGGDGVVIGKGARAWNDKLFTHHYAYQGTYDSGGYLQPGLNLAYNGTGRPEPVFTTAQANALTRVANQGSGGLQPGDALALVVDGREFAAYVDDRANLQVSNTLRPAIDAARAGRRG
ncbi:hypothetical protein EAO70_05850 [Streptomyces sp. adm13(2018)]|uniref:hypothetical protein n=1 Tax=Streptomyces sp. adm13(2018) TaxID=2479007 RepID=UPI0011CD4BB3|nr:hypothetical protein [Streptomyces sp. adm13(2018)]TXS22383.1 hypothetical protein EAO70_05850 [Streptomyces sp. adm13(2018)]